MLSDAVSKLRSDCLSLAKAYPLTEIEVAPVAQKGKKKRKDV